MNGLTFAALLIALLIVGGYALAGSPERTEEVERDDG